jgi:aspartate 1-decarboxylase
MKPALVISDRDNVATALEPLAAGAALDLDGRHVVTRAAIPSGHKLAIVDIAAGDPVHTHNVASSRGRGDLAHASPTGAAARLAEPEPPASPSSGSRA